MFPLTIRRSLAVLLLALLFATASCYSSGTEPIPAPAPRIPPKEFLLDAQPFPEGWQVHPCEPYCERAERDSQASRTFYLTGVSGHVIQEVFHFATADGSRWKFDRYEETTPHSPPPETIYHSPIADDQYLFCGVDAVPACRAGLLYGNYSVYFYLRVGPGNDVAGNIVTEYRLELDDLGRILRAMDERYAELFNIPLSPSEAQ